MTTDIILLITKLPINSIVQKNIFLNAQVNAANIGYHSINKYKNIYSLIINENELRQELRDNKSDIKLLAKKLMIKKKLLK